MRAISRSANAQYDIKSRQHLMERSFARCTRYGFDQARPARHLANADSGLSDLCHPEYASVDSVCFQTEESSCGTVARCSKNSGKVFRIAQFTYSSEKEPVFSRR